MKIGSYFHVVSALKDDADIDVNMLDLDFDSETMAIFARIHLKKVPNNTGRDLVEMTNVFFGQNVRVFANVSGQKVTNL